MPLWSNREHNITPEEILLAVGPGPARFGPSAGREQSLAEQLQQLPHEQRQQVLELRQQWLQALGLATTDDLLYHDFYLLVLRIHDFSVEEALKCMNMLFLRKHPLRIATLPSVQSALLNTKVRRDVVELGNGGGEKIPLLEAISSCQ